MNSKGYEIFVMNFFKKLNEEGGHKLSKFKHNKRFKGKSTRTWDVDVSYSFMLNKLKFNVFIECKYWDQSVDANKISLLNECLKDCDAHKGIVVTTVGFQSGAIRAAKKLGIGLLILKDHQEEEWVCHFDGNHVAFDSANSEEHIYTSNKNSKFLSGKIEPSGNFYEYIKNHLPQEICNMFRTNDLSPLWSMSKSKLKLIERRITKVVSDYEKIETCGLPISISGADYGHTLNELFLIVASQTYDS